MLETPPAGPAPIAQIASSDVLRPLAELMQSNRRLDDVLEGLRQAIADARGAAELLNAQLGAQMTALS